MIEVAVGTHSFQFFKRFCLFVKQFENSIPFRNVRIEHHTLLQPLPVSAEMNRGEKRVRKGDITAEIVSKRFGTLD